MISRRTRKAIRGTNQYFANDLSYLNPELLAREAILRLLPSMVIARTVIRNFDPAPALFGDVVKIKRPGTFKMTRKDGICDDIVVQDITGDRIQARLDQWPQVSFKICDGETRSVPDLIDQELAPATQALAEGIDYIVSGQVHRYVTKANVTGHLGKITKDNVNDYILDTFGAMNDANVPDTDRILMLTGKTQIAGLKNDLFVRADASGSTDALRRANLGSLYNFDIFTPSHQPSIGGGQPLTTAVAAAGYPVGTTAITFGTVVSGPFTVGEWILIDGDDTPQHITATNGTTTATIFPGLHTATLINAVIKAIIPGAVNLAAGYRGYNSTSGKPGWAKEITVDGFTVAPKIGQGVTFGAQTDIYSVIGVNALVGITLDRPVETALTDNMTVNLMPAGEYNMAYRPSAFALIIRPIAEPLRGAGAVSRTINFKGLSIRVTIYYDGKQQAHIVTLDFLAGINTLDDTQIFPMFG